MKSSGGLDREHFTMVFAGDLRALTKNPHATATPYGLPLIVGFGNAFAEFDDFCDQRDALVYALARINAATPESTNSATIAQFQSWVRAVAGTALADLAAKTGRDPSSTPDVSDEYPGRTNP